MVVCLRWHDADRVDNVLFCRVDLMTCWRSVDRATVVVLQNYFSQCLFIEVSRFWDCLLRKRLESSGGHSPKADIVDGVSWLCVCKGLLTSSVAIGSVSKSINNLFNDLRSHWLSSSWCWLRVVYDVHWLEAAVLAQLRNTVALIRVDFCVNVTRNWLLWHGLVTAITSRLN